MSSKANPPTGNLATGQTDCTLITTNLSNNPRSLALLTPGSSALPTIIAQSFPCWHVSKVANLRADNHLRCAHHSPKP